MSKPRLLILSASIGAGHKKAGEALSQAYEERLGGEVRHIDFFRFASPRFSRWVEEAYYVVTKHTPSIYKLLYRMADRPNSRVKRSELLIGLRKYHALIRDFRPDAIISTHFFPAAIVSHMYPHFSIPNGVVLTDYISHHIWVNPNTNLYFVAHEGMVDELKQLEVAPSKIRVSGIPIRPAFTKEFDQHELRRKMGLDPNLFTLMVMSGGNAVGPLTEILKILGKLEEQFQVVFITGANRKLFLQLQEILGEMNINGQVLGYIDNVHEYMAASDLLISKAGGLTVTEALTIGLPMVIIQPTPGQEDGNTMFLLKSNAGRYLKNVDGLGQLVAELIKNPSLIGQMKQNALQYSRPDSTAVILSEMDQLRREGNPAL
jgi:processive 1,2-diacylglycerol beta-glucosyltransferase